MEQVFFRVHIRVVSSFCAIAGPEVRSVLERTLLILSFISLGLLGLMHYSFTGAYIDQQCFQSSLLPINYNYSGDNNYDNCNSNNTKVFFSSDIIYIHLTNQFSSYNISNYKSPLKIPHVDIVDHHHKDLDKLFQTINDKESEDQYHYRQDQEKEEGIATCPTYMFSLEKGYLFLPASARGKYNISTTEFYLPWDSIEKCFDIKFIRKVTSTTSYKSVIPFHLILRFIGADTIIINLIRSIFHDNGHLYIEQTRKLIDVSFYGRFIFFVSSTKSFGNPPIRENIDIDRNPGIDIRYENPLTCSNGGLVSGSNESASYANDYSNVTDGVACASMSINQTQQQNYFFAFCDKLLFKMSILVASTFLFFATTSMVSFILKQTQSRMLKFTFLLQYHVRNQIPYSALVFIHVFESLIFVPIVLGVLFFLFEMFQDKLFSFMLLSLVWLSECYSVMSLRTYISIQYFPKIFFLYFMLLQMYVFSCPFGFTYSAFGTTALFAIHLMLYFLNKFEIPAYASGNISAIRPRYFYMSNTPLPSTPSPLNATMATVTTVPLIEENIPLQSLSPIPSNGRIQDVNIPNHNFTSSSHMSQRPQPNGNMVDSNFVRRSTYSEPGGAAGSNSSRSLPQTTDSISPRLDQTRSNNNNNFMSASSIGIRRDISFSTPLEEIIAYEQAIKRHRIFLQAQQGTNEFVSTSAIRSTSASKGYRSQYQQHHVDVSVDDSVSVCTDIDEGLSGGDIGLALFGSDSGSVMNEDRSAGSMSRSNSFTDFHSSSSELKYVSKDLQFEISKQIQRQQMAAVMAFDLPIPLPEHTSATVLSPGQQLVTTDSDTVSAKHISDSDTTSEECTNKQIELNINTKRSSTKREGLFSFISSLKWGSGVGKSRDAAGKSKLMSNTSTVSSSHDTTEITNIDSSRTSDTSIHQLHSTSSSSPSRTRSRASSGVSSHASHVLNDSTVWSEQEDHVYSDLTQMTSSNLSNNNNNNTPSTPPRTAHVQSLITISLSSPMASSALENCKENYKPVQYRSSSSNSSNPSSSSQLLNQRAPARNLPNSYTRHSLGLNSPSTARSRLRSASASGFDNSDSNHNSHSIHSLIADDSESPSQLTQHASSMNYGVETRRRALSYGRDENRDDVLRQRFEDEYRKESQGFSIFGFHEDDDEDGDN